MAFAPKFNITPKINKALVEIERVRGFLDAVKLKDDWIADMQKKALILESHHSTHIEGTALSLEQAKSILEGGKVKGVNRDDERELLNYKKAMDFISKYLGKDDPVSEGIVRELHKILVKGVRGENADPGNYRKIQNYVVNSRTREVVYTPPGPLDVPHLMREFTEWVSKAEDVSPILVAGIAQFQFVHIHPFIDGNGRTARLLSTLILYKTGYDFKRLFTISEYYDKDRPSYYQAIQTVRKNNMDMTTWIEYFVDGLRSQMTEIQAKGEQLIKQDSQFQKIKKIGLNKRQEKAVKHLIIKSTLSVNEYQSVASCIRRTAQRDLEELVEKKVIKIVAKSATDPTKHYVLL
ncbi:MAG TPA: Fic family protein [Candidatus Omnitrophica bacterium]|nr:MAG: cell filamentation protein Fic [Omnitrophica WOR_2 bacterium GWA2_45_18]HBR14329.1 Fic family protein [Candidatus Omnitrophota bacterium]